MGRTDVTASQVCLVHCIITFGSGDNWLAIDYLIRQVRIITSTELPANIHECYISFNCIATHASVKH